MKDGGQICLWGQELLMPWAKAACIKNRAFDREYYKNLVVTYLTQLGKRRAAIWICSCSLRRSVTSSDSA